MRYIFYIMVSFSMLNALSLDSMMGIVIKNSHDIARLEDNINIARENIKLASKWDNPTLSLGVNDIQLNDITNRSIEAMQTQYISISQIIPTNSKIAIKRNIAYQNQEIDRLLLDNKILEIKSLLYEYLSLRLVIIKKLALIRGYRKNIIKLKRLYQELSKIDSKNHLRAIEANILNSHLIIQEQNFKSSLKIIKLQIEKLLYKNITKISFGLSLPIKVGRININRHPLILSKESSVQKEAYNIRLQKAKRVPNIKLTGGYFQRSDREDYLSFSASMPLPVYGREDIEIEKSKISRLQRYNELEIYKNSFKSRISILKEMMRSSYKNYKRVKSYIIKDRKYVQQILDKKVSIEKIDITIVIDNLNKTIQEELLALNELARYYSAYSKLTYFKIGRR